MCLGWPGKVGSAEVSGLDGRPASTDSSRGEGAAGQGASPVGPASVPPVAVPGGETFPYPSALRCLPVLPSSSRGARLIHSCTVTREPSDGYAPAFSLGDSFFQRWTDDGKERFFSVEASKVVA